MEKLKIKVCGMRDVENIRAIAALPIDYMGFIFYEKSPRNITDWIDLKNLGLKKVGVFVNAELNFVASKISTFRLNAVQLHGSETPQYLQELKIKNDELGMHDLEIWKAFSVDEHFDFEKTKPYEGLADFFLFDTKTSQHGGAGVKFDWSVLEKYNATTPFFLAGGITADDGVLIKNLKLRIRNLYGVDLNSRFELAPALKDVEKLRRFVAEIKEY